MKDYAGQRMFEMCVEAAQRIASKGGRAPTYDPKKDPALKAYKENRR